MMYFEGKGCEESFREGRRWWEREGWREEEGYARRIRSIEKYDDYNEIYSIIKLISVEREEAKKKLEEELLEEEKNRGGDKEVRNLAIGRWSGAEMGKKTRKGNFQFRSRSSNHWTFLSGSRSRRCSRE